MQSAFVTRTSLARWVVTVRHRKLNACPDTKAEQIAEDIRESIAKHGFGGRQDFPGGASMGVDACPPLVHPLDECLAG